VYNILNTIQWLASLEVYVLVLDEGAVSHCDPGCQTVVEKTNKQKTDNQIKLCCGWKKKPRQSDKIV